MVGQHARTKDYPLIYRLAAVSRAGTPVHLKLPCAVITSTKDIQTSLSRWRELALEKLTCMHEWNRFQRHNLALRHARSHRLKEATNNNGSRCLHLRGVFDDHRYASSLAIGGFEGEFTRRRRSGIAGIVLRLTSCTPWAIWGKPKYRGSYPWRVVIYKVRPMSHLLQVSASGLQL